MSQEISLFLKAKAWKCNKLYQKSKNGEQNYIVKHSSIQILAGFPKQTSRLDSMAGGLPVWDAAGGTANFEIFEKANFEVVACTELPAFTLYKYTFSDT